MCHRKQCQKSFPDLTLRYNLKAIDFEKVGEDRWDIMIKVDWPMKSTESEFFKKVEDLPKAKTLSFLH